MILLLDNYDSFTYNLVDYFNQLGVEVKVFRNDEGFERITSHDYKAVVISPGPEIPEKAGKCMEVLRYYINKKPILGICLGHQAIGEHFGGELKKGLRPMHGKVTEIELQKDPVFADIPQKINVVQYNSLVIDKLPASIRVIAKSGNKEIMAVRHKDLPVWGLQFHPEAALTQYGLVILKNWLDYNDIT